MDSANQQPLSPGNIARYSGEYTFVHIRTTFDPRRSTYAGALPLHQTRPCRKGSAWYGDSTAAHVEHMGSTHTQTPHALAQHTEQELTYVRFFKLNLLYYVLAMQQYSCCQCMTLLFNLLS